MHARGGFRLYAAVLSAMCTVHGFVYFAITDWRVGPPRCVKHSFVMCFTCREMGLNSLPVAFGPEVAKWITVGTIDVTQIAVAAYLAFGRHENVYAAVLTALILPQVCMLSPPSVSEQACADYVHCKCACCRPKIWLVHNAAIDHMACAADLLPVQVFHP